MLLCVVFFVKIFDRLGYWVKYSHITNIINAEITCYLYFPVIEPLLGPRLRLPTLAPNLYLPTLATNLYLPILAPNFYLSTLVNPEPGLAYTNFVPPICIYWPWPTTIITVLCICIYLPIYSSSSGSSNISNSSNSLELDNINISMPFLVN